jgi:hypothetical protein
MYWALALIILLTIGVLYLGVSGFVGRVESAETMFGILLAFALGMVFTELAKVWSTEKRAKSVIDDLFSEIKDIARDITSSDAGLLYSSTWSSIRISGIPDRIHPKLRKQLAEVFLQLEIYNDDQRRFEDYSIGPDAEENIELDLKHAADQSRSALLTLCETVLEQYRTGHFRVL